MTAVFMSAHGALAAPRSTHASTASLAVPSAYQLVATAAGVPPALLWALAQQESGLLRGSRWAPWPWTLNVGGVPARFATRTGACRALHSALERVPSRRIDIGLTQINWGYHGRRVHSPCELLDPYRNLAVACRLLVELHRDGETWIATAARYHRPAGGEQAIRYGASVQKRLSHLQQVATGRPTMSRSASALSP